MQKVQSVLNYWETKSKLQSQINNEIINRFEIDYLGSRKSKTAEMEAKTASLFSAVSNRNSSGKVLFSVRKIVSPCVHACR